MQAAASSARFKVAAAAGPGCVAVAVMLWPMRHAAFGAIDDHEIAWALMGRSRLPVSEWWGEFSRGTSEHLGRLRPVYWLGRTLEMGVFGSHPALWYGFRFLLAMIVVGAVVWACRPASLWARALAGAVVVAGPQAETFYRLGPAETYAVALAAVATGWASSRWRSGARCPASFLGPLLLVVGSGLSKESFLVLPVIAVAGLAVAGWHTWDRRDTAVASAVLMGTAVCGLLLLWKMSLYGDVYATQRTAGAVGAAGKSLLRMTARSSGWPFLLAFGLAQRRHRLVALLIGGVVAALFVSQSVFYATADLPGRYLFPTVIVAPLAVLLAAKSLKGHGWRPVQVALALGCAGVVLASTVNGQRSAAAWSARTRSFQSSLAALRGTPDIVFVADKVGTDYEPIIATALWLRSEHDPASFAVVLPRVEKSPLEAELASNLVSSSARQLGFVPTWRPDCVAVAFDTSQRGPCPRTIVERW